MAFGLISTTAMLALGMPPAQASALVHTAEIFTTGASGSWHVYHQNVDWRLTMRLAIAGVAGAVLGAWILSNLDASFMRPFVSVYLLLIGLYILLKATLLSERPTTKRLARAGRLRRRLSRCQRWRRLGTGRHIVAGRRRTFAAAGDRFGQHRGVLCHGARPRPPFCLSSARRRCSSSCRSFSADCSPRRSADGWRNGCRRG